MENQTKSIIFKKIFTVMANTNAIFSTAIISKLDNGDVVAILSWRVDGEYKEIRFTATLQEYDEISRACLWKRIADDYFAKLYNTSVIKEGSHQGCNKSKEHMSNEVKKLTEKKLNATAQKVVDFLTAHKSTAYTLEEIADGIGAEMKFSGAITRLLKTKNNPDGIISHGAKREKIVEVKRKVSTYMIEADGE